MKSATKPISASLRSLVNREVNRQVDKVFKKHFEQLKSNQDDLKRLCEQAHSASNKLRSITEGDVPIKQLQMRGVAQNQAMQFLADSFASKLTEMLRERDQLLMALSKEGKNAVVHAGAA